MVVLTRRLGRSGLMAETDDAAVDHMHRLVVQEFSTWLGVWTADGAAKKKGQVKFLDYGETAESDVCGRLGWVSEGRPWELLNWP